MPRSSSMQSSSAAGRDGVLLAPCQAGLFDYAYDRDSAMFSRDDFEHVYRPSCRPLAPATSTSSSMGTMLTLESLRQLYARYGDTVNGRIGAVVFAAPDIDMDVFSSAMSRIGPLHQQDHRHRFNKAIAHSRCRGEYSWRNDEGRRCREGRHRGAARGKVLTLPMQAGVSSTTICPIECGGAAGDTPLD